MANWNTKKLNIGGSNIVFIDGVAREQISNTNDAVGVLEARVDNLLDQSEVSNGTLRTADTLFTSTVPSLGNVSTDVGYIDLTDGIDDYDEIEIRYNAFGKTGVVRLNPADVAVVGSSGNPFHWSEVEANNTIVTENNTSRTVHRFMCFTLYKFSDVDRLSVAAFVWGWNGSASNNGAVNQSFTASWNSTDGAWKTSGFIGGILSVTGIKYTDAGSAKDAELVDMRIGWDGTEYESAGDALRAQISALHTALTAITTAQIQTLFE